MKIYNTETKTHPVIIHAPAISKWERFDENPLWKPIHDAFFSSKKRNLSFPKYASIITWNSNKKKEVLERSLDQLGLPYQIIKKTPWKDFDKVITTRKAIDDLNTECILCMDAYDVLVLDDLSEMIDSFMDGNTGMCFNAEKRFWPDMKITEGCKKIEEKINPHCSSKYLNAGVWIARKDFLKETLDLCIRRRPLILAEIEDHMIQKDGLNDVKKDDQIIFHHLFTEMHPQITIDSQCNFFQVIKYCTELDLKWQANDIRRISVL